MTEPAFELAAEEAALPAPGTAWEPMTQRRVLLLALPIIGENLLQVAVGAVDTLLVGRLGADAIIGVSCYDSLERALDATKLGADYVAFGRFFPSATKPQAPCAQLDTLRAAHDALSIPIVAIGGITTANGQSLLDAGADLLAVIEGVFSAEGGPESAVRQFRRLWD